MSELKPRDPKPLLGGKTGSRPPLSPWSHTVSSYGGSRIITEFYRWDEEVSPIITDIPGFSADAVAHMTITFVERHTGEVIDVHDHYFAGGEALEKIRRDFKFVVVPCWRIARKLSSGFPAYTTIDMNTVLDPFIDCQPRYGHWGEYAEIEFSKLKSATLKVSMRRKTPKGGTFVIAEVLYGKDGRVVGCDCDIERRGHRYSIRMRPGSNGRMFIKQLTHYDPAFRGEKIVLFSSTGAGDFRAKLRKRGLIKEEPDSSTPAAVKPSGKAKKNKAPRGHSWTPDEEAYIAGHPELTARELAAKFGVTPKAIERRRAAIRKKADAAEER